MTRATLTPMTYGNLPSRELFGSDFRAECPEGLAVAFKGSDARALDRSGAIGPAIGTWSESTTWNAVTALRSLWLRGDDDAGNLASAIMLALGFEWI